MNFIEAIRAGFRNYGSFKGRTPRSGFWFWRLFIGLGSFAAIMLDKGFFGVHTGHVFIMSPLNFLFLLATLLPDIAVQVRRLHDLNRSGWWMLMLLLPIVGFIVMIIFWCRKGTAAGANRFGPEPLPVTVA